MVDGPGLFISLAILAAAMATAGFANWQARQPFERRISGMPWLWIQFVAVAVCLVMAAHLISVLTGHDFHSRRLSY
jgi:uncharacterized membrane protein YidH (DUF202 family)